MWIYRSFCDHRLFLLNPIAPFANPKAQSYAAPRKSTTKRLAVDLSIDLSSNQSLHFRVLEYARGNLS